MYLFSKDILRQLNTTDPNAKVEQEVEEKYEDQWDCESIVCMFPITFFFLTFFLNEIILFSYPFFFYFCFYSFPQNKIK